jgi:hypothetical protein
MFVLVLGLNVCTENPGINSWLRGTAYRVAVPEDPQGLARDAKKRHRSAKFFFARNHILYFCISTLKCPLPSGDVKVFHRQV